jgi:hypothetical protein
LCVYVIIKNILQSLPESVMEIFPETTYRQCARYIYVNLEEEKILYVLELKLRFWGASKSFKYLNHCSHMQDIGELKVVLLIGWRTSILRPR